VILDALVFDFDGLILDTETPIFEEWRATFRARGQELGLDVWQHSLGTFGTYDPCAHLSRLTGEAFDREALREEVRARNLVRCQALPLLPGVRERAEEGRAAGMRTAVASSSTSAWVEGWLERHGIRHLFETVCARDHVERVKPAPDLFLLAATRLGVPADRCLVFEDSPNGIRAAQAAGMRCVAIPNAVTRTLPMEGADLVLASLAERSLPDILASLDRLAPARR
jgi:HAD superfamily hydrolase (TIGR01509 family)